MRPALTGRYHVIFAQEGKAVADRISVSSIKPKMKFEGTITKVELSGARVDIGAERDAFLHISEVQPGKMVARVADVLKEGEPITVWAKQVKVPEGVVLLTRIEPPPLDWSDLQRGLKLTGKVVKVEDFGAFVNLGAPKDGLVPVGSMAKTHVNKASDVVKEGDEIIVWVTRVSRKENRIGLSMVEPPAVDWNDIRPGQIFTGKVARLEHFGAFVDIGAEREGMVHVSEMGSGYIGQPSDVVKVGEEVEVRVLEVNPKKRQIKLTMKMDFEADLAEAQVDETPALTPMQLAFQAAQQNNQPALVAGKAAHPIDRAEHEDIFARTIRQHRQQ
jgi:small subunit ribosomal protein S1